MPEERATLPDSPRCPFCGRCESELMNAFGSHASVATYWCRACRSPFEMLKWRGGEGIGSPSEPDEGGSCSRP